MKFFRSIFLAISGPCLVLSAFSRGADAAPDSVQPAKFVQTQGMAVTVQSGDTPSSIATKYCGGAKNHQLVWKGDERKMPIGQLVISAECAESTKQSKPEGSDEKKPLDSSETGLAGDAVRRFQNIGADPVCTARDIRSGTCREKQKAKLVQNGRTPEQVEKIFDAFDSDRCEKRFIPNGSVFDGQINGSVVWDKTQFTLRGRKGVYGFVCPAIDDRQEVFIPECGNIPFNRVVVPREPVREHIEVAKEKEHRGGCLWEGTVYGEIVEGGISGSVETSCQYSVGENTTAGWYGRVSGGQYTPSGWTENRAGVYPIGFRIRQKGATFLGVPVDEMKFDFAIGGVYAAGGDGKDVRKEALIQPAIWSAGQVRKEGIPITDTVSMTLEGMVFVQVPLGGSTNTITWQNKPVGEEKIRPEFGFLVRAGFPGLLDPIEGETPVQDFGFQDRGEGIALESGEGSTLIPEVTGGIFFIPGDKNSPGGKLEVGFSNERKTFRIGCGPRWPNTTIGCDSEWNWGQEADMDDRDESLVAITDGATSTAKHLGVTPEELKAVAQERATSMPRAIPQKTASAPTSDQSIVTSTSCEAGWGDATCFSAPAHGDSMPSIKSEVVEISRPVTNDSSTPDVSGWNG